MLMGAVKKQDFKLRRGTFKYIEGELAAYHDTLKELEKLKNHIILSTPIPSEGRSNLPGDPTGKAGTLILTHKTIVKIEEITDVIKEVYNRLPQKKQELIEIVYWKKPQLLTWDGIAMELHVGRATALRWRDEVIYAIAQMVGMR